MTRRAVTLQHAVAVAKNFDTVVAVKTAAFGIGNAFVRLQCRLFCAGRQFNGFIRETSAGWNKSRSGASKASSSLSATPAQGSGEV